MIVDQLKHRCESNRSDLKEITIYLISSATARGLVDCLLLGEAETVSLSQMDTELHRKNHPMMTSFSFDSYLSLLAR